MIAVILFALGAFISVVGLATGLAIYYGWALSVGWNLVMVKAFNLPHLSVVAGVAIIALVAFATGSGLRGLLEGASDSKEKNKKFPWNKVLVSLGYPILFLLEMKILAGLL